MSSNKTLLKFEADWCAPCKALSSILNDILEDDKYSHIDLVCINVDENSKLTSKYSIRSVPTLILLNDDEKVVDVLFGLVGEDQLEEFLSQ